MGAPNDVNREIIFKVLKRFPTTPTLTLAKKIFNDNPLCFETLEQARGAIRYYRGEKGDLLRKDLKDKSNMNKKQPIPKMPQSASVPKEIYHVPKANNNILVISDLHIPYHDNAAIECALDYGLEKGVNTIIINGDLLDFHQLSRFMKDPRKRSVKEEFDACRAMLEYIRHWFPTQKIIWIAGNHDKRYEHWLMTKAPEIFDDSYYSMPERLRLNDLKIDYLDDNILIRAGKLFITHGHLVLSGIFSPVNTARGVYMKAKQSVLVGHTHQVSQHMEKNLSQELTCCWSIGCLCELQPDYMPFNKHVHGFAHVTIHKDSNFTVQNYTILDGKIL